MARIAIDAGHGGTNPGAVYEGRQEKDDVLRLALEVARILRNEGVDVVLTRTTDITQSPIEKARLANEQGVDFFISLHRNSSPTPNQYSGVETLVYDDSGVKTEMAENINVRLEGAGFRNLGIKERPGLVVLRRTQMPALLVEAGFINSDEDNRTFDENFEQIAQAIADGILDTLQSQGISQVDIVSGQPEVSDDVQDEADVVDETEVTIYRVQTGVFRQQENAQEMLYQLLQQGFPAYIINEDGYYKVQVGMYARLDNAIRMEAVLRRHGYSTFLTT